jgi:hypothetical protein
MVACPSGWSTRSTRSMPSSSSAVAKQFRVASRVDQRDLPETPHQHRIALADVAGRDLPVPGRERAAAGSP